MAAVIAPENLSPAGNLYCSAIARKGKLYPIYGTNLAHPIITLIYYERGRNCSVLDILLVEISPRER
jgi:hypothetical protein